MWGKSEGDTCWLGGITAACITFGLISSSMLDFIFQAGKVCDGRSTGSSGVHGDKPAGAALIRSDPGVVMVVVETDSGSGGRQAEGSSSSFLSPRVPFNPEMFTASLNLFYMFLFQPCSRVPPRTLPASRFAVFPTTFLFPAPQIRHIPPSTGKNCLLFVAE